MTATEEVAFKTTAGLAFSLPKMRWRWYVFGGMGTKWIPMQIDVAESALWHRVLTRIVLRSQWEKLR